MTRLPNRLLALAALAAVLGAAGPAPQGGKKPVPAVDFTARSPISQPYAYVSAGGFSGPDVPESPDPLVAYRWPSPKASDPLEIFILPPRTVTADPPSAFVNAASLIGPRPDVTIRGTGSLRLDFGLEMGAWIEFDSPDCPGGVEMSLSEYNEPGVEKTKAPVRHGNTYRLELNPELYDGVRFAWIHVRSLDRPWHITGVRSVNQVKPANYEGSFSCDDPVLTRAWYMSAYGVRASFCRDYFGAILMERGDRISWTGDAHPAQAAALVAFADYDFIKRNIDSTSAQDNGIRSYSLYWVLSLLDYYMYTGDAAALRFYLPNACAKLDEAYAVFGTDPKLRFYGWDERLCAGFEIWFKPGPEAQKAYQLLSIRVWNEFAAAMDGLGRPDLGEKYAGWARTKMEALRRDARWLGGLGLHSAAEAVTTGLLTPGERETLYAREFRDRVNRLSLSPFNQYFILQALARLGRRDDALGTVRDMWGGMAGYGGTTPFEVYRPEWNKFLGPNDAVPNAQCGIVSLCHPWGAGPVKWLNEEVLGIVPTSPGFAAFDVLPRPGGTLTRLAGTTPTPHGPIRVSLDMGAGRGSVTVPPGTVGRIGIPKAGRTIVRIDVDGRTAWKGATASDPGMGSAREDAEFVYFESVGPGRHEFAVEYRGRTPAYQDPPAAYAAASLAADASTRGNWHGAYGREGYILCNYDGQGRDRKSLPSYVTSLEYFRAFPKAGSPDAASWAAGTADDRALAPPPADPASRRAAAYTNSDQTMTATIGIKGVRPFRVALYFVDWERRGLRQGLEMFDAETLKMIAPVRLIRDFAGGVYAVYEYDRSVKFRIVRIRGGIISLSGIFFDPPVGK